MNNRRFVALISYIIMGVYGYYNQSWETMGIMIVLNVLGYIEGIMSTQQDKSRPNFDQVLNSQTANKVIWQI